MTLGIATVHYFTTLADPNKGSLTNRHQAGKEHFKNDLKLGASLVVPAAAVGVAAYTGKLGKLVTAAGRISSAATKATSKLFGKAKILKSAANALEKLAEKGLKNPQKAGIAGLAVLGFLYLMNRSAAYANKAGRIDQKYEDAAKIESQTKNVVLQDKFERQTTVKKPEQAPAFYE